jgi:hypothetical protein
MIKSEIKVKRIAFLIKISYFYIKYYNQAIYFSISSIFRLINIGKTNNNFSILALNISNLQKLLSSLF